MSLRGLSISHVFLYFCLSYLIFSAFRVVYYAFFHPLAKFPGPTLRAAFFFPHFYELWTGDVVYNWHALHEQYGDIVRVAPHWISVIKPEAWRDICGHGSKKPIPKDRDSYLEVEGRDGVANIASANERDHTRMRRLLNHAFSDQALRSQEHIINSYVSILISKLNKKAQSNMPVDIMRYLNFTTFDIFGDLCFAESFSALEKEEYNEWMATLFKGLKFTRMNRALRAYPLVGIPFFSLLKVVPALAKAKQKHEEYTLQKTNKRINMKTERRDFMSYILKHNNEKGMTRAEIMSTTGIMIIAGSETSATLLSGVLYYLLTNPEWMSQVREELQASFRIEAEMSFTTLSQLKIMNAVIMETFRLYPPAPSTLPRWTSEEGAMVCGNFIPPNCGITIPQYAANRSSRSFKNAHIFAPQRFLGDPEYEDDKRSVIQPFSFGPRNCIGQNLAWAEIRTILARLLWHFDIAFEGDLSGWEKQKVYVLWDKPALMVKLTPRNLP